MSFEFYTTVGEIADVFDGPHATPKLVESGSVFLGISSLKSGRLDLTQSGAISDDDFIKWTRRVTPTTGDTVFSYETRLGEAAIIPSGLKCCLGRRMGLLRPKIEKVLPDFLLYSFLGPQFQNVIKTKTIHGSTVDRVSIKDFPGFPICIPPIEQQQFVVDILKSIDEKIELNRQTNQTLETIAQTLFKEMCLPKGDELLDGWKIEALDNVADFLNGLALQKFPALNDKDYLPAIKIRELKNGITASSDKVGRNVPEKYIIKNGDLLFSWSATLEVMFWCYGEGALNQHLFKVTSEKFPLWFCYMLINHHLDGFRRIASDKTTTMGHIQRKHLTEALCFVPNNLDEIDKIISPFIEQIQNNNYETQTLTSIRDSLLPKLMNGEIKI